MLLPFVQKDFIYINYLYGSRYFHDLGFPCKQVQQCFPEKALLHQFIKPFCRIIRCFTCENNGTLTFTDPEMLTTKGKIAS